MRSVVLAFNEFVVEEYSTNSAAGGDTTPALLYHDVPHINTGSCYVAASRRNIDTCIGRSYYSRAASPLFATPPHNINKLLDADHDDDAPPRFRTVDSLIGGAQAPGPIERELYEQLLLAV